MNKFLTKLREISPYIYGLGLVTFLMQLGATLVYGTGNNIVVGRLLSAAGIVFLRSFSDSVSIFFRMFAGYLSDKIKNRVVFLVVGYGSAFILKICFFITTLEMSLDFLVILYVIVFTVDRLANAIRDPAKEAFITEQTDTKSRFTSFALRKAIGSMGTFFGGILAYFFIRNAWMQASQIYFIAILPVFSASVVLWFMFAKKFQVSLINKKQLLLNSILAVGSFCLLLLGLQTEFLLRIPNLLSSFLLAIFPVVFIQNFKHKYLQIIGTVFISWFFLHSFLGIDVFFSMANELATEHNRFAWGFQKLLFNAGHALFITLTLYHLIFFSLTRALNENRILVRIATFFKGIVLVGFVFVINSAKIFQNDLWFLKPGMLFHLFSYHCGLGHTLFYDSFLPQLLIYFLTRKSGTTVSIIYLVFFSMMKNWISEYFTSCHIGYEIDNLVYSFLICLIIFLVEKITIFLLRNLNRVLSLIALNFTGTFIAYFIGFVLQVLISTSVYGYQDIVWKKHNLFGMGLALAVILSKFIISKRIFTQRGSDNFLTYCAKTLPVDAAVIGTLYFLDLSIVATGLLLFAVNVFYNKVLLEEQDSTFNKIIYRNKPLFLFFLCFIGWFLFSDATNGLISFLKSMKFVKTLSTGKLVNTAALLGFKSALIATIIAIFYKIYRQLFLSIGLLFFILCPLFIIKPILLSIFFALITIEIKFFENLTSELLDKLAANKIPVIFPLFFCISAPLLLHMPYFFSAEFRLGLLLLLNGFIIVKGAPVQARFVYYILQGTILGLLIVGVVDWRFSYILFLAVVYLFSKVVKIFDVLKHLQVVKTFIDNRKSLRGFWRVVALALVLSLGKLNDGFFFQRAVELEYKTECALIFAFIYLFFTISSVAITFFEQKNSNKRAVLFLIVSLILCNLFMSGFVPFFSKSASFFISLFFYGMYTGAFDIVISTEISKSTENKSIIGTLFGTYYFISGILSALLSYVFFLIFVKFGCGVCGVVATFPAFIALFFII